MATETETAPPSSTTTDPEQAKASEDKPENGTKPEENGTKPPENGAPTTPTTATPTFAESKKDDESSSSSEDEDDDMDDSSRGGGGGGGSVATMQTQQSSATMRTAATMDTIHEHASEFSNYDVLLYKTAGGPLALADGQAAQQFSSIPTFHVGNNRFQVLTQLQTKEFQDRLAKKASTMDIVNKIIDIVCRQCNPAGRFLVETSSVGSARAKKSVDSGNPDWTVLNLMETQEFIRDYMASRTAGDEIIQRPNALTASLPNLPITQQQQQQAAPPPQPPAAMRATMTGVVTTEEKKRRRRSSLLRRSVSGDAASDKKKQSGNMISRAIPQFLSKAFRRRSSKYNADKLDIVLNEERSLLIRGFTAGNNRLMVMIDMQREHYNKMDARAKMAAIEELYETVDQHWKGRFMHLKEGGEEAVATGASRTKNSVPGGGGPGRFGILEEEEAKKAIQALFAAPSASSAFMAPASESAFMMASTPLTPVAEEEDKKKKKVVAVPPFGAGDDDIANMRSAAVASLQKKKQRQGLTNKIRNLTTRNHFNLTKARGLAQGSGGGGGSPTPPQQQATTTTSALSTMAPPAAPGEGSSIIMPPPTFHPGMATTASPAAVFTTTAPNGASSGILLPTPVVEPERTGSNSSGLAFGPRTASVGSGAFSISGTRTASIGSGAFTRTPSTNSNTGFAGANTSKSRDSMFSNMSDGMIEDLLEGLDVSESEIKQQK